MSFILCSGQWQDLSTGHGLPREVIQGRCFADLFFSLVLEKMAFISVKVESLATVTIWLVGVQHSMCLNCSDAVSLKQYVLSSV